jgi:hypothetical protein
MMIPLIEVVGKQADILLSRTRLACIAAMGGGYANLHLPDGYPPLAQGCQSVYQSQTSC